MDNRESQKKLKRISRLTLLCAGMLVAMLASSFNVFSNTPVKPYRPERRSTPALTQEWQDSTVTELQIIDEPLASDTTAVAMTVEPTKIFNPDPTRAVWLSALFPGLGQVYNRRYWKLPIIVGGFMGLGYATSWNNGMLRDYSRAYADVMDNDPSTKSYMDFFPPTTKEEDLNPTWLQNTFKSRKDYYRRNRDLCIICIVGVYLLAMVDAYVDASLSHFDISPSLTMDVAPAIIPDARDKLPGLGLQWALNF